MTKLKYFSRKDAGAALIEYGLLVGLVAVLVIGLVASLGGQVRTTFNDVSMALSDSMSATGAVSDPPAPIVEEPSDLVADLGNWTILAGTQDGYFGYLGPGATFEMGSKGIQNGSPEMVHQYNSTGSNAYTYLDLEGDTRFTLGPEIIFRCLGMPDLTLGSSETPDYLAANTTRYKWDGAPSYEAGTEYSCGLHDPNN